MKNILLLVILGLIIAGCATVDKAFFEINESDSKESVISRLGPPENRQFKGKNEAFQYCTTGTSFGVSTFNIIWFYDGKVTGVSSYSLNRAGMCSGHFQTINWEDAPDQVIEIRER